MYTHCKHVKATGTHRRLEQVVSKLDSVDKTEKSSIYFNNPNELIHRKVVTNAVKVSVIGIYVHIQCVNMEDCPLVKQGTELIWLDIFILVQ